MADQKKNELNKQEITALVLLLSTIGTVFGIDPLLLWGALVTNGYHLSFWAVYLPWVLIDFLAITFGLLYTLLRDEGRRNKPPRISIQ